MKTFTKINFLFSILFLCASQLLAIEGWDGAWDNVAITQLNKEDANTIAIPFATENDLQNKSIEESSFFLSLNGQWKFNWAKDPDAKPVDFHKTSFDVSGWDNIDVPSVWQVYGLEGNKNWDKPLYVNTSYPFTYTSGYSVMRDRPSNWTYNNNMKNPVGSYRREFTLPNDWSGRDIYVRFNGAGPGYYLWINGQQVGYSEDSYLPSEFKITDYVTSGTNVIAVQVYRFTSGSFLECQDFWRLTGISRDVFVWSAPKTQIRDYFFQTDLDEMFVDAKVTLDVKISGSDLAAGTLTAKVMDGSTVIAEKQINSPSVGVNTITMDVTSPKKWSAEIPNLYDLVLTLKDGSKTLDIRGGKVGFREVGVGSKGELLINGKRMIFHGVNRHDHSEKTGRTVSKEEMKMDVKTMKRLNINAVRTSHYPNNPYLYDLCDKYGLYVLAEANVECHGDGSLSGVEAFRKPMVERNQNHVKRFRNHPSIFMWSYGNESGKGGNFEFVENAIKALDKTRLTHYEGNSQWADVSSTMYANYSHIKGIGEDNLAKSNPRPHIQCENSHAMGNAMGNVREMFDLYEKYPSMTGEFIWEWKDHGIKVPVPGNEAESYWAYGGDFGDVPNDGNFVADGVIFPNHELSAKSYNVRKIYQPIDFFVKEDGKTFQLKSKLSFKSTDDLDIYYSVLEDGKILKTEKLDVVVGAEEIKEVVLDELPDDAKAETEYFIRFTVFQKEATWWAEQGYEVAREQFQIKKATKPAYQIPTTGTLSMQDNQDDITILGTNFTAVFSKSKGTLASYTLNGKQMINEPLELNVFRLPTDNDKVKTQEWDNLGIRSLTVKAGEWRTEKSTNTIDLAIQNTYSAKDTEMFTTQVGFKVLSDGTIFVNSSIDPKGKGIVLPKIGFRLGMPGDYETLTWFGRGPWDSYVDRKESCLEGLYNSTVTEQWEQYVLPQETGNKEEVRWVSLRDNQGLGLLFVAPQQMTASAVHYKAEDLYVNKNDRKKHPYEVTFDDNTIVSLNAIMRGLGNASCGSDVMPQYELKADYTLFNFMILPISSNLDEEALSAKARVESPICSPVKIERDRKNGNVSLSTTTDNTKIYYSINNGDYKLYSKAFPLLESGNVQAYCTAEGFFESMKTMVDFTAFVDKSEWNIVRYSSQSSGNEAYKSIDGDESTIWHTPWGDNAPTFPHQVVVDMGAVYTIQEFLYQPRTDGSNGRIQEYELYFSNDPTRWPVVPLKGTFMNTASEQSVLIPNNLEARFFKFVAKSNFNTDPFVSAAEFGIVALKKKEITDDDCVTIEKDVRYYIKHFYSGLYLQYKNSSSHGDFCINKLQEDNTDFIFDFLPVAGLDDTYNVRIKGQFLNKSGGWLCRLGALQDNDGRIKIENTSGCPFKMKALWNSNKYLNFDAITAGSYFYTDKTTGALWLIEKVAEGQSINENVDEDISIYYATGSKQLSITTKEKAAIRILDLWGNVVSTHESNGNFELRMDYPTGVYIISVDVNDKNFLRKIIL